MFLINELFFNCLLILILSDCDEDVAMIFACLSFCFFSPAVNVFAVFIVVCKKLGLSSLYIFILNVFMVKLNMVE